MIDAMLNICTSHQRADAIQHTFGTYFNDLARLRFRQVPLVHAAMMAHDGHVHSTKRGQESLEAACSAAMIVATDEC